MTNETGKVILLKDLSNIVSKRNQGNDIGATVTKLMNDYGAIVDIYTDESNILQGLYFQDQSMIDTFDSYPEILFVDAIYKLLELSLPLYLFVCEASNGLSEIVAATLLVKEDTTGIKWMVETFKQRNRNWTLTRLVMADKDMGERSVFKSCFPNATMLICLFHTLRTFRRELACNKIGITQQQRELCLDLLQKIAYSVNEDEYELLYCQFKDSSPKEVAVYYDEHWHPIRHEWVLGFQARSGSFMNTTNNRLESINGKLKQVISRHSSLEEFVYHFFVILRALRTERDHKVAVMLQKVKVIPFAEGSTEMDYSKYLTLYAFGFVFKQLQMINLEKEIKKVDDHWEVETSSGLQSLSTLQCTCVFNCSMRLPCRHILALRSTLDLPLFDAELCDKRWSMEYYKSTQRMFVNRVRSPQVTLTASASKDHARRLSQHEKFRKASLLTTELASVMSHASHIHFKRRMNLLQELIDYWKNGEEVSLTSVEDFSDEDYFNDSDEDMHLSDKVAQSSHITTCTCTLPLNTVTSAITNSVPVVTDVITNSVTVPVVTDVPVIADVITNSVPVVAKNNRTVLSEIKPPPKVKKRGRPKGHELTVIGMPAKKKSKKSNFQAPCSFIKLPVSAKEQIVLSWFVDCTVVGRVLEQHGQLIKEEEVECIPEKINNAVLDENVDIYLIRKYFSNDAWLLVEDVLSRKRENVSWICVSCNQDLHSRQSIICDLCMNWHHLDCVGLTKIPKTRNWFCRCCYLKLR
jgi:zinc finger SWIM domain-containing protein 3